MYPLCHCIVPKVAAYTQGLGTGGRLKESILALFTDLGISGRDPEAHGVSSLRIWGVYELLIAKEIGKHS